MTAHVINPSGYVLLEAVPKISQCVEWISRVDTRKCLQYRMLLRGTYQIRRAFKDPQKPLYLVELYFAFLLYYLACRGLTCTGDQADPLRKKAHGDSTPPPQNYQVYKRHMASSLVTVAQSTS